MNGVEIREVGKSYGNTTVITTLDLAVTTGEFMSLLGPSGCGKTTLLRMVAGLDEPTHGQILIAGDVVNDVAAGIAVQPEKRRLGMVFQSYAVWPHLSVIENVMFPLACQKVNMPERKERAVAALRSVKLETLAERRPHQLSGGQQQRVALARALAARPRVLLLDEPLSNLDANLRDEMCDELISLRKEYPMTMMYVTHDQKEALKLSDRIAVMNAGQIEQLGTPDELLSNPNSEFVKKFLRSSARN